MEKARILYGFILALLLTGFGFQVKESLIKYVSKKTTVAVTMDKETKLLLPSISLCPGFKSGILRPNRAKEFDLDMVSFFDVYPNKSDYIKGQVIISSALTENI